MHGIIFRIGLAACAVLPASGALAQAYPSQPIKVVVPFTPGTGMDIIARTVGPKLSERLGQPVIIENKPGASGNIGAEMVAKSAPDGHTVMITANTMLIAASLYRNVPFDPLADFSPISLAAWGTLLLTANPKTNINSVAGLIAQAKADPGKLTYASPGVGTPHHMSMELFKDLTGTNLLHVPYKGSAGALTDLLSGEVNLTSPCLTSRPAGSSRLRWAARNVTRTRREFRRCRNSASKERTSTCGTHSWLPKALPHRSSPGSTPSCELSLRFPISRPTSTSRAWTRPRPRPRS